MVARLRVRDAEVDGHLVQGHVDGTAAVLEVRPGDEWRVIRFSLPDGLVDGSRVSKSSARMAARPAT